MWALLLSPVVMTITVTTYVFAVRFVGPLYMKNKQPYSLKTFMQWYNVYQIVTNAMLAYMAFFALCELFSSTSWQRCETIDVCYKIGEKYIYIYRWVLLSRILDYIETMVFVLRKKHNQVSNLHLYHHASTVLYIWYIIVYAKHCYGLYLVTINSVVHIIMYTYYFLSACGPEVQRIILPFKKWLTTIQMIQLVFIIFVGANGFLFNCDPLDKTYNFITVLDISINLLFFWNFYNASYKKTKTAN